MGASIRRGSSARDMWRLACVGVVLACRGASPVGAQDSDSGTCTQVTVAGLLSDDGFPEASTLYTNNEESSDVRGMFVSETSGHFIWYSSSEPTEWTSTTPEAGVGECSGFWVISSYPAGDTFTDLVWYQTIDASCEETPAALATSDWGRATRDCDTCDSAVTNSDVVVSCVAEEDSEDGGGLSNKTVMALCIIGGVGFMFFMCLGALACCIRGKNSPENAVMPPGELTEGGIIGSKAGDPMKPGLHAHPEVVGAQHPRPEDRAPSFSSNNPIPQGSRSGPSVRSIGYS